MNHRSKNHKIKLVENKQAFFVWNYKLLLEQKIDAIKKYINKYFEKGFIRPSLLAATALVLLIRKLNDGLKICVNYRAFNKIIMKNWYLISLINKILEKLSNAAHFINLI